MKAVIIEHEAHEGVGLFGPALVTAGFELVRRFRGVERVDLEAALVVVMGGPMGVYEADQHPFLHEELAFLIERLALERPVLGICLGAQLLAAAAGAEVFAGKNGLEVGVGPVRVTKDGAADAAFAGLEKLTVAHWHGDTFAPVPGAKLLASSDRYTQQAFRLGPSLGLQFHLELTGDELGRWLDLGAAELAAKGKDVAGLKTQLGKLRAAEGTAKEVLSRIAFDFARMHRAG
jgi:GMP synthase (glutamine-hydrolysing)